MSASQRSGPAGSGVLGRTVTSIASSVSTRGRMGEMNEFATQRRKISRYFDPCAATSTRFLYAQGNSVVCCRHDDLSIERRFSRHEEEVQLLAVDNASEQGSGRLVVSYDAGQTAIVWDLMTGDEVARFASYEHLTVAAWMRNGNVAFGNTQGNVLLFEPTTQEHVSARTIDQIAVTALAPGADCRTFAIGYQNGSLLIATLQPRFTILHSLSSQRAPSPIVTLAWHGSTSRQKSDMLAVQTLDGDLRVWSISKSHTAVDSHKVVRRLAKSENFQNGPNWMGWSKNGRIIQFSDNETLSWDVRTKHVTYDVIPTLEHTRALAVYGPGALLFTLAANNTAQQFDLNAPARMVANVQHPANLLPPSPPVSIESQGETTASAALSETMSVPITHEISESDEDHMSPIARIALRTHHESASDSEPYRAASPASTQSSQMSRSSAVSSRTPGRLPSARSRGPSDGTYISISGGSSMASSSIASSMRSSPVSFREHHHRQGQRSQDMDYRDAYSVASLTSAPLGSPHQARRSGRQSRLRNEVVRSPEDSVVVDLFKYTRSRLSDIPYKRPAATENAMLTNDDLRRQMLSTIFGWNKEIEDLVRDEMSRHPLGSPSRIMLAKWLGDVDSDIMAMSSESMTSSDWMLLALSGIGTKASQHKLGLAYVQRLLENGDVHAAVTIMIGLGDYNDAIEIYHSHRRYMEALIVSCLFYPGVWERLEHIIKKWADWAINHGHQQLAIRCYACTGKEASEPWRSPSTVSFNVPPTASIPEVLSPPLSPPTIGRTPSQRGKSTLKLITTFGDNVNMKSKFYAGDGGSATPIAGGITPIVDSALSPSAQEPNTAFIRSPGQSALNTPASASARNTPNMFRGRLPSIGELPSDSHHPRDAIKNGELPTPPVDALSDPRRTRGHSRNNSVEEQYNSGMSLQRAATASPMVMREAHVRRDATNPTDSSMFQSVSSRNGPRERIPAGVNLQLQSIDTALSNYMASPGQSGQSAASSQRFHWPSRRRGPGSVASSVTSNSTSGRSFRSYGRSLDDRVNSVEAAGIAKRERSRQRSREKKEGTGRNRSRENQPMAIAHTVQQPQMQQIQRSTGLPVGMSAVGAPATSQQAIAEEMEERGRTLSRTTMKGGKRSPTSPVPMSPEDLRIYSTPKPYDADDTMSLASLVTGRSEAPSTVRKATPGINSRASSKDSRRRLSLEKRSGSATRSRSKARDRSLVRSPTSPLQITLPGLPAAPSQTQNQPSSDEEDFIKAVEAQEKFRNRHSRASSKAASELSAKGTGTTSEKRQRSTSRTREGANVSRKPTPAQTAMADALQKRPQTTSPRNVGDLRAMKTERELKKEAAARELEARRRSLARRPSAPTIPHPDELSPITTTSPMTFITTSEPPGRSTPGEGSGSASHYSPQQRSMFANRPGGTHPILGLPATPKAMRLKFEAPGGDVPAVPSLPPQHRAGSSLSHGAAKTPSPPEDVAGNNDVSLLPSTVYTPPRPMIARSSSAPIPDIMPSRYHGPSPISGQMSVPPEAGRGHYRHDSSHHQLQPTRYYQAEREVSSAHPDRQPPSFDELFPPPPPPPPPPVIKELQHLAMPPPPPPPPLRHMPSSSPKLPSGVIEIVMDDDNEQQIPPPPPPPPAPMGDFGPSQSMHTRNGSIGNGHSRGRSTADNTIAGVFSRATERMRSLSRGRNQARSPDQTGGLSPYESIPLPQMTLKTGLGEGELI